jgi:Na+/melibiose symporter-like transporter
MHAAPIEYVFLALSIAAVISTGWFFVQAVKTMQDHRHDKSDGPAQIVASDKQRGSGMRLMSSLMAMIGAIVILFVPPPPPDYAMVPQSLILIFVLIIKQCITVFSSYLSWQSQQELEEYDEHATAASRTKRQKHERDK